MEKHFIMVRDADNMILGTMVQDDPDAGPIFPQLQAPEGVTLVEDTFGFNCDAQRGSEMPFFIDGQVVWRETLPLKVVRDNVMNQIDQEAGQIVADKVGAREKEYSDAYADAQAFRDAEFQGEVPQSVADWAEIKGWTAQQAAEDVLATGDAWKAALLLIRKNRLARKQACRDATTPDEVYGALADWNTFRTQVRSQLEI